MSQINDAILAATGGPTVNDGLVTYYQANGAVSDDLQDAELEFLQALVVPVAAGSLQDMWLEFLGVQGFIGALDDRRAAFWANGGVILP